MTIDIGLMATEGNCAPHCENTVVSHSEKEAKLADLWYQVVRNPEFKNLFLGYTLEQIARHSELKSIKNYCNYHQVQIPSSEEEEDDGSDAGGSQSSVRDAEGTGRLLAFSRARRDSRSAQKDKPMVLDKGLDPTYVRGSRYNNDHAASSRIPPGATISKTAGSQNYDPNRHGPIGGSHRVPNTGGSQGQNEDPKNSRNPPWRVQCKDYRKNNQLKDRR